MKEQIQELGISDKKQPSVENLKSQPTRNCVKCIELRDIESVAPTVQMAPRIQCNQGTCSRDALLLPVSGGI